MNNEIWKTYPEFSWIQGSTMGRVKTLDRVVSNGKGTQFVEGRILKQRRINGGYMIVYFRTNGKMVGRLVHRLVAQTFLPNPNNWPQVNHKDCDRTNNCVDNLEWCTPEYNMQYKEKYGVSAAECAPKKPVIAVNLTTLEVSKFPSRIEASRELGINSAQIGKVVKGKYKQAKGYWFTEDNRNGIEIDKSKLHDVVTGKTSKRSVFAINLSTLEVCQFPSQMEASRELGIGQGNIGKVVRGQYKKTHGYWFTNADSNAVESTRNKLGSEVADRVKELMNELQPA